MSFAGARPKRLYRRFKPSTDIGAEFKQTLDALTPGGTQGKPPSPAWCTYVIKRLARGGRDADAQKLWTAYTALTPPTQQLTSAMIGVLACKPTTLNRALQLTEELTSTTQQQPTVHVYTALISGLARAASTGIGSWEQVQQLRARAEASAAAAVATGTPAVVRASMLDERFYAALVRAAGAFGHVDLAEDLLDRASAAASATSSALTSAPEQGKKERRRAEQQSQLAGEAATMQFNGLLLAHMNKGERTEALSLWERMRAEKVPLNQHSYRLAMSLFSRAKKLSAAVALMQEIQEIASAGRPAPGAKPSATVSAKDTTDAVSTSAVDDVDDEEHDTRNDDDGDDTVPLHERQASASRAVAEEDEVDADAMDEFDEYPDNNADEYPEDNADEYLDDVEEEQAEHGKKQVPLSAASAAAATPRLSTDTPRAAKLHDSLPGSRPIVVPDLQLWTSLIDAHLRADRVDSAAKLVQTMVLSGIKPDIILWRAFRGGAHRLNRGEVLTRLAPLFKDVLPSARPTKAGGTSVQRGRGGPMRSARPATARNTHTTLTGQPTATATALKQSFEGVVLPKPTRKAVGRRRVDNNNDDDNDDNDDDDDDDLKSSRGASKFRPRSVSRGRGGGGGGGRGGSGSGGSRGRGGGASRRGK